MRVGIVEAASGALLSWVGAFGFALLAFYLSPAAQAAETNPNVVLILADNVGYGDLGPTAAASCAAFRRPGSTRWRARACA